MSALLLRSLTGGVLIAVILLLRVLLRRYLPQNTFRALWIIALFHLLLPRLPQSPLSLYNLQFGAAQMPGGKIEGTGTVFTVQGLPIVSGQWSDAAAQSFRERGDLFFRLWLIGMVLCAGWFLMGYLRIARKVHTAQDVPAEVMVWWMREVKHPITLRQSSAVSTPLACGYLKPIILLPVHTDWSDRETLRCVLLHESAHVRRGDLWLKAGVAAAVSIYWFAPWVWLMLYKAEQDIELACDAAVLRRLGADQRRSYAMALIRMEEQKPQRSILASGFAGNALEARIIAIMKNKKTTKAALAAAILLCLCVTMVLAAAARPVEGAEVAKPTTKPVEEVKKQEVEQKAEAPVEQEEKPIYDKESYEQIYWVWPVPSSNNITRGFGGRVHPITGVMDFDHITIAASKDILAAQGGKVSEVYFDKGTGNTVHIDHGNGFETVYAHLAEIHVKVGQYVKDAQVIGIAGQTGAVTGDCLAFWVYENGTAIDPMQFYNIEPKFVLGNEIEP